jgi:signal transduction histidine kinase
MMVACSIGILFFSFRGKFDNSSRYFLLAEVLMLLVMLKVIAANLCPELATPPFLFLGNLLHISSEIAVIFSLVGLSRNNLKIKHYFYAIGCSAIYCLLIEYSRVFINPNLPHALFPVFSFMAAIAAFWSIKQETDPELASNSFLKWIAYLEIGLAVLALIRFSSFFLFEPISPRVPNTASILLFSLYGTISVFRYISYQSLRISWVGTKKPPQSNLLNKNIALAAQDNAELTQKLISSNRALGVSALANTLTHQLSQPITGIAIQAEIAQRDIPKTKENEASIKILEKIGTETNKLSELVNNLRSLFTRGGGDFKKRQLSSTCETVVNLYNPTFTSSQVSFDVDYKANPLVNINEIQIQQVLINVLNNALEAVSQNTSQAKRISLQVTNNDSDAIITITDSGGGVAPEVQNELFQLYKTTKSNGMGIGLWLSKTIIERHHGSISINRDTEIGTSVEIRLPLAH